MKSNFLKIKKYSAIIFSLMYVVLISTPVFSEELNSTNYTIQEYNLRSGNEMNSTNFSVTGNTDQTHTGIFSVSNLPLIEGTISTCGKINAPGTYTLSRDLEGITGPCFIVASDNVVIDGAGHTVTATDSNTSYAVTATSSSPGGHAYGTTTVQNITFIGFEGGVNAEGASVTSGTSNGGNGGRVYVKDAVLGTLSVAGGISINDGGDAGILYTLNTTAVASGTLAYAKGGDSIVCGYGGSGGKITLIDSPGFVPYIDAGLTNTKLISDGGGCSQTPNGNPGLAGEVEVVNSNPNGGETPNQGAGNDQVGTKTLLDRLLPEVKFNINLSPFDLIPLPTFGTGEDSFSFIDKIANFFKSDTIAILEERFSATNNLLKHLNIHSVYDLFVIKNNPKQIEDTKQTGLFTVYSKEVKPLRTFVTSNSNGDVIQLVRARSGQTIVITLLPTVLTGDYEGVFNGEKIVFKNNTVEITVPQQAGVYQLSTYASPMILNIEVLNQNMFDRTNTNIFLIIIEKIIALVKNFYSFILFQF